MGVQPTGMTSQEVRAMIRSGEWTGPTACLAPGYVQANLVVLPGRLADEFEGFCRANAQALPILERTEPGSATPAKLAPESDVRLDLPRYRVYREGRLDEEPTDVMTLWHADFVAFLIGCSFTFDDLLRANGIRVRHVELGRNVPMYVTNREMEPVGPFAGPLVVSMRPIRRNDIDCVVGLTRHIRVSLGEPPTAGSPCGLEPEALKYAAHGEPLHVGSPHALGVADLERPDYGDPVPIEEGEVPVFWACGVTAQAVAERSRVPLMITHAPGHMFITDVQIGDLASG